jgi:ATP-binding cassette subfamily B protein
VSPGEVVLVTALTFRILNGSRDLALALIGTIQPLAVIGDMLRVVGRPHAVPDRPNARPFAPRGGSVELDSVAYAYPDGHAVFRDFSLRSRPGRRSASSARRARASRR